MWNAKLLTTLALLGLSSSTLFAPYSLPLEQLEHTPDNAPDQRHELVKRDGNCPKGYGSCAYMGFPGSCCKGNANCGLDNVGHVACCPVGAVCTGTISGAFATDGSGQTTTATLSGGVSPAVAATGDYSVVINA